MLRRRLLRAAAAAATSAAAAAAVACSTSPAHAEPTDEEKVKKLRNYVTGSSSPGGLELLVHNISH